MFYTKKEMRKIRLQKALRCLQGVIIGLGFTFVLLVLLALGN